MRRSAVATAARPEAARATVLLSAAAAALIGLFLVYGAGFAQMDALHNAAHDSRHAFAFPCH
jgi:cobalt transporter subunit CbtB